MISVLYVDDEANLLHLGKIFLEDTGDFRVDTIQAPAEVLSHIAKNNYDAIVCDYQMPGISGIGLLKEIRRIIPDIPFILFTGRGREEVVIEAINNGADFYLQKGTDTDAQFTELASKLRQAVSRRQAERSLRESEKKLADIINFLPDATLAIDRTGAVIAWNKAIEEMTGVPAPAILGKGNYEYALPFYGTRRPMLIDLIFRPDDAIAREYTRLVREKDTLMAETTGARARGDRKYLAVKASPLYNGNGEIIGAIESIRDVTTQKLAEDELRQAHEKLTASDEELRQQYDELSRAENSIRQKEEQLAEIAHTIPGVVFQFFARPDGSTGMYYISGRSRDILGLDNTEADFLDRCTACIHPDDRKSFLDSIQAAIRQSEKWFFEGRFTKPGGDMLWLQGVSSPTFHENELVFSGIIFDITDRKLAEEAYREETQKYQTLVEHSQDAVVIIQEGNVVFANAALFEITGFRKEDVIGQPIGNLIAPEDREMVVSWNRERQEGKAVPESFEFSLLQADGNSRRRIKLNAGIAAYNGKTATIGTFHDVTFERLREETLQKSEQKYRELAELLPQIVFEMDTDLRITYANNFAFSALGVSREEMEKGIRALDHIDPSQHLIVLENVQKILRGEPHQSPEYGILRKDGTKFPALIYSSPIYQDNNLTGFRGVIVDISAWKAATAAQKESEELYRSLAETAQDMIFIVDKDDIVIYVNSYCQQVMNRKSSEIIGKPRSALFYGPAGALQYHSIQHVFTTGQPERFENRIPLPDKGDTWQDTHFVPLKKADGTISAILGISRDISQLKQAQTALKRANEKLNLLNSITRHDVANQLTLLHGYIQLAMMKEQTSVVGDFLRKIDAACDKIQRQIEFTRTYQDLGIKAPDWYRLETVIEKTKPDGIVFTSLCRDFEIFADPMLEKVFFNIFDNAIRHGERVTAMSVRCAGENEHLKIVIEDDGIGIPLDEKQKIFQKGFGRNTGYGLFLVREILAITDIEIHETGKHGSGARFEITIPKSGFKRVLKP